MAMCGSGNNHINIGILHIGIQNESYTYIENIGLLGDQHGLSNWFQTTAVRIRGSLSIRQFDET